MPVNLKSLSPEKQAEYEELIRVYKGLYKKLSDLESEGARLKKEVRAIVDKTKMKNILNSIINQPDKYV